MNDFSALAWLSDAALLVGLSTTRIAVAFLLLPIFSPDTVPAMVRNAIFMALGVLVVALQPVVDTTHWSALHWMTLFGKEAGLGLALGFGLAAFLWAFSAAGQIIDTKVGVNAQLTDPLSGQQVSISGAFLGRMACYLFMVSSGFSLFVGVLLESFALWPLGQLVLIPKLSGVVLFENHLNDLMSLAFLLAAPVLVVMFAIDLVLGLVNSYAPQINLLSISASLKALASSAVMLLMLSTLTHGFSDAMRKIVGAILPQLAAIISR
jgi:type III secretion protein SpaR/YscT/HrcT